ncbi:hypothetical protein Hanom_Chr01g00092761 [Helianthus anomalus]
MFVFKLKLVRLPPFRSVCRSVLGQFDIVLTLEIATERGKHKRIYTLIDKAKKMNIGTDIDVVRAILVRSSW